MSIAARLGLVMVLFPCIAEAATVGDVCELKGPLKVTADLKGKSKKATSLKKGQSLTIVEVAGAKVRVRGTGVEGYVPLSTLTKVCTFTTLGPPSAAAEMPTTAAPPDETAKPPVAESAASTPASPTTPAKSAGASTEVASTGGREKIRIAVMDLKGSDAIAADLLQSLTALIPTELDALGLFKAMSSQDIMRMLSFEASRQLMGCDDTSCLAEVGGALGVDYIVTGTLTKVDAQYLLQLQLMNMREGRAEGRVARDFTGALSGLLDEVRVATRLLVRDLLSTRSGELAMSVSEEGATLRLDGVIVGVSPLAPLAAPGGTHTVTAEKEGFVRLARDIEIKAGGRTAVTLSLQPSAEFVRRYQASAGTRRLLAWSTVVAGLAGLGGGAAMYVVSGQKAASLNARIDRYAASNPRSTAEYNAIQKQDKAIANLELGAVVLGGVGAAAAAVGAMLLVTGDDPHRYDATASVTAGPLSFAWLPTPGGGLLSAGTVF